MFGRHKISHRHHKVIHWVTLASTLSHIFCCGIPMVVGLLSLLAGMGALTTILPGLESMHHRMHSIELPLLVFSALMLALGWAVHVHGRKVDCHSTGCSHPPCEPKKTRASLLMIIATALFAFNVVTLVFMHKDEPAAIHHMEDPHQH